MSLGRPRIGATALHQRGFALIAILALAALIAAYLISIGLNRSRAELSNDQEDRSMTALRQAKAALIAYAASEQWQRYKSQATDQPGGLPCPDTDPDTSPGNTGVSPGICSGSAQRVGRLPFATIGSEDLRDASGERLWYAVSSNFYKNSANVINSDKQGLLTVTGSAPANNVVAIVFAPGPAVRDSTLPGVIQNRSAANYNRIASYLEGYTPSASNYTFTSSALPSDTFNDRLLVITQAELMAVVEPVVAARIERDVVPALQNYYNAPSSSYPYPSGFHAYPFPAPFDPTQLQPAYKGDNSLTRGMLPITTDPTWLQWDPSSVSVAQIAGGTGTGTTGPPTITISPYPPNCSASTTTQISCVIFYSPGSPPDTNNRPNIQLQATLRKAGRALPKPFAIDDPIMYNSNGDQMGGGTYASWSDASPSPPSVTVTMLPTGDATVVFQGVLVNALPFPDGTGGKVTITVPITYGPLTDPSDPYVGWFVRNEWYRQTYYAASQGFLPGGGNSCNSPSPYPCLTVNNLRASYAPPIDNKQAILVFAGRSLNGNGRPMFNNLPDYFESSNLTAANNPATFVFENRSGVPTSINDRVVVVSP